MMARWVCSHGTLQTARHLATRFFLPRFCSGVIYLPNSQKLATLYLVGIDHISPKSAALVQNVIQRVQPDVVAVELCKGRAKNLFSRDAQFKKFSLWDIFRIAGGLKQRLFTYAVQNIYARLAATGLKPGEEFRVAILEGMALGAKLYFIDQDIKVTLKRAGQLFSLKDVLHFLCDSETVKDKYPNLYRAFTHVEILEIVEALRERRAMGECLEVLETYFPGLAKAFLHERNAFMVKKLRLMEGCIVCVVGAFHVPGMHKLWDEAELQYLTAVERSP